MPLSFRYGYISPGDVVYVPAGAMVMEKAVVADNVTIRVLTPLLSTDLVDFVLFACGTQKTLGAI